MIEYFDKGVIVIDGADGVGKSTQIELLKKVYTNVNFMKFPNYNSNTGFFITKYLDGSLDKIFTIDENNGYMETIKKISTLYTMDRVAWFNEFYDKFKPLFCDRYTTSNILHMSALIHMNGGTEKDIDHYIEYLENLEYKIFNIPRPTITIYLDADHTQLMKNLKGTGYSLDIHENEQHLTAIDVVKQHIFDRCRWVVINCLDEDGNMKPVETINCQICNIIDTYYQNVYQYIYENDNKELIK